MIYSPFVPHRDVSESRRAHPQRRSLVYPIDWPELAAAIKFGRAKGRCEHCRCPHGRHVVRLRDGRWYDDDRAHWRDTRGRRIRMPRTFDQLHRQLTFDGLAVAVAHRRTRIILAGAHLDHDPANNHPRNLAALCQRCHLLHDLPQHRRRRWRTLFLRRALGDLFVGPYPAAVDTSGTPTRRARLYRKPA